MAHTFNEPINCADCGCEVTVTSSRQKRCKACAKIHNLKCNKERARAKPKVPPSNNTEIARVNGESRAKGLSYGYGVAILGR